MFDPDYVKQWGKGPFVAVDVVLSDWNDNILLIKRGDGTWANAGGLVEPEEELVDAAKRELKEETGIDLNKIEKFPVSRNQAIPFHAPNRDPRARIITFAFHFVVRDLTKIKFRASDDAKDAKIFHLQDLDSIKFYADHRKIIERMLIAA